MPKGLEDAEWRYLECTLFITAEEGGVARAMYAMRRMHEFVIQGVLAMIVGFIHSILQLK